MPEFNHLRVLKDAQGPIGDSYPAARDITVDDLMTHRSGLAYGFTSVGPIALAYQQTLGDVLNNDPEPDVWLKALSTLPLSYPPGERMHYSHSTDVLGFLVGRVAGKPFRDVLFEKIFNPLGMVDTDFYIPPEKRDRAAVVYRLEEDSSFSPVPFRRHDLPPAYCGGGGGLISTADDYLKFARMMLGKGEVDGVRLLKPETVALMVANRLTDAQRAIPFLGMPLWAAQGFGLGVSVVMDQEKPSWMGPCTNGAFGWPGAFGTWWAADPAENLIMIYLVQNSMPPESASRLATAQHMAAGAALPMFQALTYEALGR
jgi:CubicO group peptidase (beta-lactamase class C family)